MWDHKGLAAVRLPLPSRQTVPGPCTPPWGKHPAILLSDRQVRHSGMLSAQRTAVPVGAIPTSR